MARTAQHKSSPPEYNPKHAEHQPAKLTKIFSRRGRVLIGSFVALAIIGTAVPAVAASSANGGVPLTQVMQTAADVNGQSGQVSLAAVEATWTSSRYPTSPRTAVPYLSATKAADATYLKFDTSSLAGKTVVSASLQLRVASTTATAAGVQVYAAPSSWSAKSLTQTNQPGHVDNLVNTGSVAAVAGKTISIPLKSTAAIWSEDRTSFELRYSQGQKSTTFYRGGSYGPQLKLTLKDGTVVSPSPMPSPSATPTQPAPGPSTAPDPGASSDLAFAVAKSNSSDKKVFAHYFPPYPVSFDNQPTASDYYTRNYLSPTGEGGIHAASAGLLRDRPEGRAPLTGDWQLADMITEVNQAADAGIDGFNVDILSLSGGNWDRTVLLMKAAQQSGRNFTIVPNLDTTASAGKADINTIAAKLAELYKYSSAYKLDTGAYVLSSFAAEKQSPAWWTQLRNTLSGSYGVKTSFIAIMLNASDANLKAFAPISYALGNWGTRTPEATASNPNLAAKAHALGTKWMAPVAIQDERPHSFSYAEAKNTETLRTSWDRAQSDGADLVQLVTWNDYSEGTAFAPSAGHGHSFLDINAYFATRFKTGSAPIVKGDAIYVTNRIQPFAAIPTTPQQLMTPTLSGSTVKPRDAVEVLTFLSKSADVTVTIGNTTQTYTAPAGLSTKDFPIAVGGISATAVRGSSQVAKVVSTHPIVAKPLVQDLAYYASSSRGK